MDINERTDGQMVGQTDGHTDGQTDGRTDISNYRVEKIIKKVKKGNKEFMRVSWRTDPTN